ncbi:hypothetical protein AB0I28_20930 [Phytomonospora sp. NPDC050363]|uniref:hypothetical protein n=1 Tax=Phytomonospora sp. NPDC050363 TaxID=3155642 RepID=UPI0033C18B71
MRAARNWFSDTTGGLPRAFWHLWLVTLINRLGSFVVIYMTLYLSVVRKFGPFEVGLLIAAQGAGAIIGTQVAGVLATAGAAARRCCCRTSWPSWSCSRCPSPTTSGRSGSCWAPWAPH